MMAHTDFGIARLAAVQAVGLVTCAEEAEHATPAAGAVGGKRTGILSP